MAQSYSVEAVISATDKSYSSAMKSGIKSADKFESSNKSALASIKNIASGLGVYKLITVATDMLANSLDGAINRYDTLTKFPKVMTQMGYSTNQAAASSEKLSKGIQGLPTTLDGIISNAQSMALLTGDLKSATDTTLALNDAFLASGSGAVDAERGVRQYSQMLAKGKVDAQSWYTLQETMGYGLKEVAKSFGYAGSAATTELYQALKDGVITFDQFNAKLVELDKGVGGFAELAKTSSGGIKTAFTNMQTAIVRGTANTVKAIDTGLSGTKFKSIENIISSTGKGIESVMSGTVAPALGFAAQNADLLATAAIGVGVAYIAYKGPLTAISNAQKELNALEGVAMEQGRSLHDVITKNTDGTKKESVAKLQKKAALAEEKAAQQEATAVKLEEIAVQKRVIAESERATAESYKSEAQKKAEIGAINASKEAKEALSKAEKLSKVATEADTKAKKAAETASKSNATAAQKLSAEKLAEKAASAKVAAETAKETAAKKQVAAQTAAATVETKKSDVYKKAETQATAANTAAETASKQAKTARTQAEELNTKATAANTAVQAAQSTSMSLGAAVVGLFTGATTVQTVATVAATTATGALTAAVNMLLSPMMLVTAAIGLVTAGVTALISWFKKNNAAYYEAGDAVEEYGKKNEELKDSLKESTESYEDNTSAAKASTKTSLDIASSVKKMANNYNGSADSARKLQAKIQVLNSTCRGLNLTFDESTGKLSMTNEQIEAYIKTSETAARKTALVDHMEEMATQLSEVQGEMINAEIEIDNWHAQMEAGEMTEHQFNKRKKEMQEEITKLGETADTVSSEMAQYESKYSQILAEEEAAQKAVRNSQQQAIKDVASQYHVSTEEIIAEMDKENWTLAEYVAENEKKLDENKSAVEKYAAQWRISSDVISSECQRQGITVEEWNSKVTTAYETLTSGLSNLTDKIELDSERTWNAVTNNQDDAIEKTRYFADMYAKLIDAGVSESYLNAIGATGPEAIPLLEGMLASGTDTVLAKQGEWEEAYNGIITDPLKRITESDQFMSIGEDVASGLARGLKNNAKVATSASTDMAKETAEAAKNELGIHSPSTVFAEMGKYIMQGLVQGIKQNKNLLNGVFEGVMQSPLKSLESSISRSLTSVSSAFTRSFQGVANTTRTQMSTVNQAVNSGMTNVSLTTTNGMNRVNTAISSGFNRTISTVNSFSGRYKATMSTAFNSVASTTSSGMNRFNSSISSGMNRALSTVRSIAGRIPSQFSGLYNEMYSIGSYAMSGLNNGLWSRSSTVMSTASSIAYSVASRMRSALQIHSPSKIMAKIGGYTMEGFQIGLESQQSRIKRILNETSSMVQSGLNTALNAGNLSGSISTSASLNMNSTDGLLQRLISAVEDGKIIMLDSGEFVGATTNKYDNAIGQKMSNEKRWARA